jgi:formamidopyrimidine-DNA glycosylase
MAISTAELDGVMMKSAPATSFKMPLASRRKAPELSSDRKPCMPELPEVETIVRSVTPFIVGRTIEAAEFHSARVTRTNRRSSSRAIAGSVITGVRRLGKQIFIELDRGVLYVHLGMTGKLLWNTEPGKYTRATLHLDTGTLQYDDVRQFGRVEFYREIPSNLECIGPDALKVSFAEFYARLKKRKRQIKALLLDQSFVCGVGNIYADESLYEARIHPRTLSTKLSKRRALCLYDSMIRILNASIDRRGSSISDYVDGAGERGSFQQLHMAYGRTGKPCSRCGSPIRRTVIAQRSTHYCPRCQRP